MELESRAWISTQLAKPFLDPDHRVFNICTMDGQAYYVSGKAMSACRSVSWAQQIFEVVTPRAFDAAAATVAPGCEGLIYLPYLYGERSPVMDEQAQGVFFGMTTMHKREHFLRAVLEGVAFSLSQITGVLRERQTIDRMQIIGGGAHSKLWKRSSQTSVTSRCKMCLFSPITPPASAQRRPLALASDSIATLRRPPKRSRTAPASRPTRPHSPPMRIQRRATLPSIRP